MTGKVTRIIVRNGTKDEWSPDGEIAMLGVGEIGYELDTNRLKIGNGEADSEGLVAWNDCEYITTVTGVLQQSDNIIELDEDGQIFVRKLDVTEIVERLEKIENLVPAYVVRTDQEVDGGRLLHDPFSKILFDFPSIKLRPLAVQGLQDLNDPAITTEQVLSNFFQSILGIDIDPDIRKYSIMSVTLNNVTGTEIQLPAKLAADVKYVDWGDGSIEEGVRTHDYAVTFADDNDFKQYTITAIFEWDNSENYLNFSDINKLNWLTDVRRFGILEGEAKPKLTDTRAAFFGFAGEKISAFNTLEFSGVTDTTRMFSRVPKFDQDINHLFKLDTITTTVSMFNEAVNYTNGGVPIEFSNLSSVTFITGMFQGSGVNDTTLDGVADWDITNVRDEPYDDENLGTSVRGGMRELFYRTSNFNSNNDTNLSGWDVSALDGNANLFHGVAPGGSGRQNFSTPKHDEDLLPNLWEPKPTITFEIEEE